MRRDPQSVFIGRDRFSTIKSNGRFALWAALVCGASLAAQAPVAVDWPQFLGPTRNGVYHGPPLADSWGAAGPRVVWRKQVGAGFAGPAVVGRRVILFHRVGNEEVVESLDSATGSLDMALRLPDHLSRRFRLRRGSAGRAGRCQRRDLHVRRRRSAPRHRSRQGHAALERRHHEALRRAQGVLWRRRVAARRRRPRDRQHRRRQRRASSPSTRRAARSLWTATDDDASYSSGVSAHHWRQASRRVSDA